MLTEELRARIKALKTIIPDRIEASTDAVLDLRGAEAVVDLTDGRDEEHTWIEDERIVDVGSPVIPATGLGAVPPSAASVFRRLEPADRELAHLVATGMTDADIALALDVPPRSIELGVRSLLALTGYANRMELMIAWHGG